MNVTHHRSLRRRLGFSFVSFWRVVRTVSLWRVTLAASGWITLLGILVMPPGSLPCVALVFGFVLVCPGLALSRLLPAREVVEQWVLTVALSTSLAILVSVTLTVLRIDSVTLRLELLAVITTVAGLIDIRRIARGPAPVPPANGTA